MDTEVTKMTDEAIRQEMAQIVDSGSSMIRRTFTSASLLAEVKRSASRYHALEAELQRREAVPA